MIKRPFEYGEPTGPMNFVPRESGPGIAVWEYTVDSIHFNPNGVLHGGVLMALLDTAMGHALAEIVVPQGRINAAAQMNVHFLAPIRGGVIRAVGKVRKVGKRLAVVEGEAVDQNGVVVGVATATHSLLP